MHWHSPLQQIPLSAPPQMLPFKSLGHENESHSQYFPEMISPAFCLEWHKHSPHIQSPRFEHKIDEFMFLKLNKS